MSIVINLILLLGTIPSIILFLPKLALANSITSSADIHTPYQIIPLPQPSVPKNPDRPLPNQNPEHSPLVPTDTIPAEKAIKLVIRLSEKKVYVYQNKEQITSYPIAIGRAGWETPVGEFQVMEMIPEPSWQHPFTGEIIPPGPDNPLGQRWIGFWTNGQEVIGFHGTPNEETIGHAASHGCVRMFNRDVLSLYEQVSIGTPVIVEP